MSKAKKPKRGPIATIYMDELGEWRWRVQTANSRKVNNSGQGFPTMREALRAFKAAQAAMIWAQVRIKV